MFRNLSLTRQAIFSMLLVLLTAAICYLFEGIMGYRVVAFILLLVVSLTALLFQFRPVVIAALLSALLWNFFFIPPKFTFLIDNAEDVLLFFMYFVIAFINAVLTNRIRKIEKQVQEKDDKAKALKLYNTLLNSLSHELKTPVAAIVAASDNLLEQPSQLSESTKTELTKEISVAALRLNQQVENLLSMSRLESGFVQLKRDWCDVQELLYEAVNRLSEPLKNHKLNITIEEGLPFYKLDYVLIEQVIYNLLYNAALYTPEYSDIMIEIKNKSDKAYSLQLNNSEHSQLVRESSLLLIEIEDRGPGFPPDEIGKVFDKFYRMQQAKAGGTGLGLSIVKGFVEAHNGRVVLENVPHGAKFTITIPAETTYINQLKNE